RAEPAPEGDPRDGGRGDGAPLAERRPNRRVAGQDRGRWAVDPRDLVRGGPVLLVWHGAGGARGPGRGAAQGNDGHVQRPTVRRRSGARRGHRVPDPRRGSRPHLPGSPKHTLRYAGQAQGGAEIAPFTVGIDTGGTFVDVVVSDGAELRLCKTPSDPQDLVGA